ncbi:hypothetical protein LCGC14_2427090, partial [marine sediment metagenome]
MAAICPYDQVSECHGPQDGSLWWECPVHGARLTEAWTKLCLRDLAYYTRWKDGPREAATARPTVQRGPGTELLKMLKTPVAVLKFLREAREFLLRRQNKKRGCADSCITYARKMDAWGVAGCRDRLEKIVDHLEAQASREG